MADVIDVLVVVDAQSIMKYITDNKMKNEMDVNKPILLGNKSEYIHMLTPPNKEHYMSGQGTSELWIKVNIGDVVRWRGVTLSKDSEYSAALLKLKSVGGTPQNYFATPKVQPIHSYVPVLKSDNAILNPDPLEVNFQETIGYYWETSIKNMPIPGKSITQNYTFTVGIYKNGNPKAYVHWDPAIVLDNK
ncbi:AidA/PixA family protein [Xenorhabdus sp. PB62.4]|uniref:AidA/PixA family protein n=1 Tax=Xenorhabdus sp. PB62.4 TaxID=1851573 RepID=UPI00165732C2|nr:AidA/PixA family protein [Xenorhabdus sp. PB62.4]MBC8954212.1 inclusion body protein [Xenorhabdus sp. PB62.4]